MKKKTIITMLIILTVFTMLTGIITGCQATKDTIKEKPQTSASEKFLPDTDITRKELAVALWTLSDKPVVNFLMNFVDVPEDKDYSEAVRWAVATNLMTGVDDKTFEPDSLVTRQTLAMALWQIDEKPVIDFLINFIDIHDGEEYTDAVRWVVAEGLILPENEKTFGLTQNVKRKELVMSLWTQNDKPVVNYAMNYTDISGEEEFAEAVRWASAMQLIAGVQS